MWPQECKQYFSKIWPSDLLFEPTQPMIEFYLYIIKANIQNTFEEDLIINIAPRE